MIHPLPSRFFWLAASVFFIPFFAQAQGVMQEIPEGTDLSQTKTTVVADVNVTDVMVEEKDGAVSGTFALQGKMGQQNGITYGLVVMNKENTVLDVKFLGQDVTVRQGEIKTVPFTYTFPGFLGGDVIIFLRAETLEGLPVGTQKVLEKNFGNEKNQLTCVSKDNLAEFSCTHDIGGELMVEYHAGSFFGAVVADEKIVATASVPLIFTPNLKAGAYTAVVRDVQSGEPEILSFRVPGAFGEIRNVVVYQGEKVNEISGVVTAVASPMGGTTIQAVLSDKNGKCGEVATTLEGGIGEFSLKTEACAMGNVEVVLKSADGSVLDTTTQPFSTQDIRAGEKGIAENAVTQETKGGLAKEKIVPIFLGITGLIMVLLGVIYLVRRRKNAMLVFLFALTGLSFFASVPHASALTLGASTMGYMGEIGYSVYVNISTSQSSYIPGETMVVNYGIDVNTDAGAGAPSSITDSSVAYNSAGGGAPVWDVSWPASGVFPVTASVPPGLSLPDNSSAGPYNGSVTFTVPLTMTVGSHFFANRLILHASYPGLTPSTKFAQMTGNLIFDVVAPAPPVTSIDPCAPAARNDSRVLWFICGGGSICPAASNLFMTGYLDKETYAPGEPVNFFVTLSSDDNPQYVSGVSPLARAQLPGGSLSADVFPGTYTPDQVRGDISGSVLLGSAPAVSGTVQVTYGSAGYTPRTGSLGVCVVPPAAPTINVHF